MKRALAWLRGRPRLGALLAGALMATGQAPFDLWVLVFPAVALAGLVFLDATGGRRAGWLGWLFGTAHFAVALSWIVEPFMVDAARDGWMAPFALVFMAGGLALFWGLAFGLAHVLARSDAGRIAALAVIWSLAELARAYVLTGFPWASPAQVWVGTPAMALLAWIGPHGLTLLTLGAGLSLALALRPADRRLIGVVPVAGFAALALGASALAPESVLSDRVVRLIQPNAPQDKKWDPEFIWRYFQLQLDYTAVNDGSTRPDLIVWPETSIPPFLSNAGGELAAIARAAAGVPLVAGIRRRSGARLFNSMIVLDGTGAVAGLYDKAHLVPFGEYVPFGDLAARFGISGMAARDGNGFSAGPGPQLLDIAGLGRAVPLICYEAVFAQDAGGAPGRGDYLLQITNDAWFGSFSGPYQHLAQSRMRAVEQGLPMLRAANTGISAVIGPDGAIIDALALNTAGYLDVALPQPQPPTPYARSGDWPVVTLLLAALALVLIAALRRRGTNND